MRFFFPIILVSTPRIIFAANNGMICGAGEHWVSPHHRRAYTRGDGRHFKATDVKGHCQRNPRDYAVWNPKLKEGAPPFWRVAGEKPSKWTTEERERVIEALEETPDILKDKDISGVYRMKESTPPGNPASNDYADFVLYDSAFDPPFVLTHVLDHELAHRLFEKLSEKEKRSFRTASGWSTDKGDHPERPESQFLRKNGMLSVAEDFADDAAAYAHEPSRLKRVAPKIYRWFEIHFGNRLKARDKK